MPIIFFDTETTGLTGPIVLLQWAEGLEGEVHLEDLWHKSINQILELFDKIVNNPDGVCAFNITFDWFHIVQMYTTLLVMKRKGTNCGTELIDLLEEYVYAEREARDLDVCVKPIKSCDLMLVARRGVYQSTMDRKAIRVKRIPTVLADKLADELEKRIPLKDIYFARRKDKHARKWKVFDIIKNQGQPDETIDKDFKNIVLKFHSSSALKVLAADALNLKVEDVLKYSDIEISKNLWPEELGYAPYALADPLVEQSHKEGNGWRKSWPHFIQFHIRHWQFNSLARIYAKNDVVYLQKLYTFFDSPELGDDDSELAIMISCCKWRGFAVDVEALKKLKIENLKKIGQTPTAPIRARKWLEEVMSADEKLVMGGSTKKVILQALTKLKTDCPECIIPNETKIYCTKCNGTRLIEHPVAERAQAILEARIAQYEIGLFDKLIRSGRLHADFKVIGTLSSRMAGGRDKGVEATGKKTKKGDGLNPQGIPRKKPIRKAFTLIPTNSTDFIVCGGDFDAFEVTLADAAYNDLRLRQELLTCGNCNHVCTNEEYQKTFCPNCKTCGNTKCNYQFTESEYLEIKDKKKEICPKCKQSETTRKKIHGIFATQLFPDKTYQEVLASKGSNYDMYDLGKRGVFSTIYGGDHNTIKEKLGIDIEIAEAAYQRWITKFNGVGIAQRRVFDRFCSARQPGGIGSNVEWHNPADYMESLMGFRRYFILENQICKALFDLATKPPKEWRTINVKVIRRERMQTVSGAVQSALYGGMFQIQAASMRAAKNHEIQSAGATITKHVQRKIWDLQPTGVSSWIVQPMNVHDEILCVTRKGHEAELEKVVYNTVETFRPKIPLIKIDWKTNMANWGEK